MALRDVPPIRNRKSKIKRRLYLTKFGKGWFIKKHKDFWRKVGLGE